MTAATRVAIAGGGIGGLARATALARARIDVTVRERAPRPATRGSGLVLAPNGVKALRAIGAALVDALRDAGSVAGATGCSGRIGAGSCCSVTRRTR